MAVKDGADDNTTSIVRKSDIHSLGTNQHAYVVISTLVHLLVLIMAGSLDDIGTLFA